MGIEVNPTFQDPQFEPAVIILAPMAEPGECISTLLDRFASIGQGGSERGLDGGSVQ